MKCAACCAFLSASGSHEALRPATISRQTDEEARWGWSVVEWGGSYREDSTFRQLRDGDGVEACSKQLWVPFLEKTIRV